jgi:hypothetical protein
MKSIAEKNLKNGSFSFPKNHATVLLKNTYIKNYPADSIISAG